MKKEEIVFLSNMSYGSLAQLVDDGVGLGLRDMVELSKFGIDNEFIDTLKEENVEFKNFPTDEELQGLSIKKTAEKDDLRTVVHKGISDIMIRVKNKYGMSSPDYNRFGSSGLYNESDSDFVRSSRRVTRLAIEYLANLHSKGLRQAEIDILNENINSLDGSIDIKEQAVKDRDTATQRRAKMANDLYKLVNELFDYGKQVFYDSDEAKYNDYVIYSNKTKSDSEESDNSDAKNTKSPDNPITDTNDNTPII